MFCCCFDVSIYWLETTVTANTKHSLLKLSKNELVGWSLDYKVKCDDVSKSVQDMLEIKANILNSMFTKTLWLLEVPLRKV